MTDLRTIERDSIGDYALSAVWWGLVCLSIFGGLCGLMALLSGGPAGIVLMVWAAGLLWWLWWIRWGA